MPALQDGARIGEEFVSYIQLVRPVLDRLRGYQKARALDTYSDTLVELLDIAEARAVGEEPAINPPRKR